MSALSLSIHSKGAAVAMAKGPDVLRRHMNLAVLRLTKMVERDGKHNAAKAFSTLTNSIHHRMVTPLIGEVYTGMDYARMVEDGTGPGGWPSDQSMEDWIRVKGITPNDPSMDERDLAFVMARSIALHGTPKQPYFKPALAGNRAAGIKLSDQAVTNAVREMNS